MGRVPKDWVVSISKLGGGLVFQPPGEAARKLNHVRIMVDLDKSRVTYGKLYVRILIDGGYVDNNGKVISRTATPDKAVEGHIFLGNELE